MRRLALGVAILCLVTIGCEGKPSSGERLEDAKPATASPSVGPSAVSEAAQSLLDARTGTFTSRLSWATTRGEESLTVEGTYDLDLPGAEFRLPDSKPLLPSTLPIPASGGPIALVVRDDSLFIRRGSARWADVHLDDVGPGSHLMLGFPTDVAASPDMLDLLRNEDWISQVTPVADNRLEGQILSRAAISLLNAGTLNWMLNQIRDPAEIEQAFSGNVSFEVSLDSEGGLRRARVDLTPIVEGMVDVLGLGNEAALAAEASSVWTFGEKGSAVQIPNPSP